MAEDKRTFILDAGLGIVRMDGYLRKNAGTSLGEKVTITPVELKEAKKVYTTKCFDPYCKNIEIDPTTKIVTSIGNSRYLQTLKDYEINNYVESISTENAFVDLNKVLQSNNPSLSLFINTIVTKKVLSICYFEPDCLEITEKRDLQYYYHRYLSFLEKVEEKSSSVKSLYHGDLSNLEEIDLSYLYGYNELHPYLVLNKTTSRLFGRILLYTFKDEEANQNFKIMSDVAEKVKAIIVDKLGVDEVEVTGEASFANDLGADSLDTVELIMEFEKEFNIAIPDDQAENIGTVGEAIKYIETNV